MGGKHKGSVRRGEKTFRRFAVKAYFRLLMTGKMLRDEISFRSPVPLSRRLGYLRRGFTTKSALKYGLEDGNTGDYLPDWFWPGTMNLNGPFRHLLDNKLVFHQVLRRYGEFLPRNMALIIDGRIFPLDGGEPESEGWDHRSLAKHAPVVLKPVQGAFAHGIFFLTKGDGQLFLNGESLSADDLRGLVEGLDQYLVCERVRHHPAMEKLYPHSANTVKVLTVRDVGSREPFVAAACLRVGTDASRPFDSLGRGGLTSRIGIEKGRLGRARGPFTREEEGHESHPGTGARIEGLTLPHWDLIKSTVLGICSSLPYLNYLVWDLVVTATGFKILEGNNHPGLALLQMHYPLLKDPRMRKFYIHHRVVRS